MKILEEGSCSRSVRLMVDQGVFDGFDIRDGEMVMFVKFITISPIGYLRTLDHRQNALTK